MNTAALRAPDRIRERPKQCRQDFIATLDLNIAGELMPLHCYGKWQPGYAETRDEPGEPEGYEFTLLLLDLDGEEFDVTHSVALTMWAQRELREVGE